MGFTGYFGTPTGASIVENARPKVKTEDQPKPVADTNIKEEEDDVLVKHDGDAAIDDQPDAQYPQLFPINEGIIRNWEICRSGHVVLINTVHLLMLQTRDASRL